MPERAFHWLCDRLVDHVKSLIRNGEMTERRLARLMGYSQPHVHNVLAGVRGMNVRFADDLLAALGLSLEELSNGDSARSPLNHVLVPMCPGAISANRGFPRENRSHSAIFVPARAVAAAGGALAMRVGEDEQAMWPTIWPGDIVVIDPSPAVRTNPNVDGVYVLKVSGRGRLRRCKKIGGRLLTVSDHSGSGEEGPTAWAELDNKSILDVVRGRVIWVSRSLEEDAA